MQQKQGRVQPTVQKKGGININDNASLETEADVMGARALSTTQAKSEGETIVQRKGIASNNIQMKEGEVPSTFMGLKVIGYGYGSIGVDPLIGDGIVRRYLLKGKAEDWRKVLSNSDGYHFFNNYVLPFLSEAMRKASGSVKHSYPSSTTQWTYKQSGNLGTEDILEFLKALYDTSDSTKSAVDLPNSIWEADANVMSYVNATWEGLADFIGMCQHLIIKHKSESDQYKLDKKDIKTLTEQGHTTGQVIANTPYVVEAMVQNTVATAINSVKAIMTSNHQDGNQREVDEKITLNLLMVENSARLASAAITQYGSSVTGLNKGSEKVFNTLWGFIPFAGKITTTVAGEVKEKLNEGFKETLKVGGKYNNTSKLKEELSDKFDSAIQKIYDPNSDDYYIRPSDLASIKNTFGRVITSNV